MPMGQHSHRNRFISTHPLGLNWTPSRSNKCCCSGQLGGGAAGMVDYAVAGVAAVQLGMAEDVAYQPRIVVAADQAGNLTVAGHLAAGYLPYGGQNLVNQVLVQYFAHGGIPFLGIRYPLQAAVSMRQLVHGTEIAAVLHQLGKGAGLGDAAIF